MFVNSKLGCARLARSLERDGLRTTALHGNKSQDERLKFLPFLPFQDPDMCVRMIREFAGDPSVCGFLC